jgi:hypothetical protein
MAQLLQPVLRSRRQLQRLQSGQPLRLLLHQWLSHERGAELPLQASTQPVQGRPLRPVVLDVRRVLSDWLRQVRQEPEMALQRRILPSRLPQHHLD